MSLRTKKIFRGMRHFNGIFHIGNIIVSNAAGKPTDNRSWICRHFGYVLMVVLALPSFVSLAYFLYDRYTSSTNIPLVTQYDQVKKPAADDGLYVWDKTSLINVGKIGDIPVDERGLPSGDARLYVNRLRSSVELADSAYKNGQFDVAVEAAKLGWESVCCLWMFEKNRALVKQLSPYTGFYLSKIAALKAEEAFSQKKYVEAEAYALFSYWPNVKNPNPYYLALLYVIKFQSKGLRIIPFDPIDGMEDSSPKKDRQICDFICKALGQGDGAKGRQILAILMKWGYVFPYKIEKHTHKLVPFEMRTSFDSGIKVEMRSIRIDDASSDVFSSQWVGFGKEEEFNLTDCYRKAMLQAEFDRSILDSSIRLQSTNSVFTAQPKVR